MGVWVIAASALVALAAWPSFITRSGDEAHARSMPTMAPVEADYTLREGETVAGPLIGWNFGEGHLHNEQLVEAVQRRCQFDEGDLRVIILEGQPIQTQKQWYRIVDGKTGLIEEGYVTVEDMLARQPWPDPDDELPVHPVTHGADAAR